MDSWTDRCGICGRPLARVGRARTYVHADQFHQRFDHRPVPVRHTRREPVAIAAGWGPDRATRPTHLRVA